MHSSKNEKFDEPDAPTLQGKTQSFTLEVDPAGTPKNIIYQQTWTQHSPKFYILLTMHHEMILGKWPTWRTILCYVFIFIFNSLHVSSTSCSSSGETDCDNTTSSSCHSVSVAVSCAGQKFTSDLHVTWPLTATRGCIDTICLSWWWAQRAQNM